MAIYCKCWTSHLRFSCAPTILLFFFFFFFQNKTRGLFGTWSWDMSDDFTLPDGRVSGVNLNNFESAHRDFGIHCTYGFAKYIALLLLDVAQF